MGQRLNIEILDNKEVLANCYYHWSGYTSSALHLTKEIIGSSMIRDEFLQAIPDKIAYAVALLKLTGAGNVDRNAGLISTSTEDIEETRRWQEAGVYIDIGTQTIVFDLFYELGDDEIEEQEIDVNRMNPIDINIMQCSFEEFDYYYNTIIGLTNNGIYHILTPAGPFNFIE